MIVPATINLFKKLFQTDDYAVVTQLWAEVILDYYTCWRVLLLYGTNVRAVKLTNCKTTGFLNELLLLFARDLLSYHNRSYSSVCIQISYE